MRDVTDANEVLGNGEDNRIIYYHVKLKKNWFRKKPVFLEHMSYYEQLFSEQYMVRPVFDVGGLIYLMLRKLERGVDWDKQDALMRSYRNLMYKLSYVDIRWYRSEIGYIHVDGQKTDVMWALAFLTQVFPAKPLLCETVPDEQLKDVLPYQFSIQNGMYVGENAIESASQNDAMPDIWDTGRESPSEISKAYNTPVYDPDFRPDTDEMFAIPDGRIAKYIKMDMRYQLADQHGRGLTAMNRHNITASLIKDFEDLIHHQQFMEYTVFQMRYAAFMNKVHNLEHMMQGLEPAAYDMLPIAERGLPYAQDDTIDRTNWMDADSLKYVDEKVERNLNHLSEDEIKKIMKLAGASVISRVRGYDIEYQMYQATGTPEGLCREIRFEKASVLYDDFARLDSRQVIPFPQIVYRVLCNDPEKGNSRISEFEKIRYKIFGRGYADFLSYQLEQKLTRSKRKMYETALGRLEKRYLAPALK